MCVCDCVCAHARVFVLDLKANNLRNLCFLNINAWANVGQLNLICRDFPVTGHERPASLFLTHTHFLGSLPPLPSLHSPLPVSRVTHCLQAFHSALLSLLLTLLFPFRAPACSIMWPASTSRFLHKTSAGPTASDRMTWKSATSPQRH